jgi:hypothetical protein
MRTKILTTGLLLLILLTSCQPHAVIEATPIPNTVGEAVSATMAAKKTEQPKPIKQAKEAKQTEAEVIDPLTGLPLADPAILNRRPVMVKVSNFPRLGRPHAGLSFADIVFDYFIGAGQDRFLAVYYSQDSPSIGPIRSGRFVDVQLVQMYTGVLIYGSADADTDAEITARLGKYAISNLEAPCPAVCGSDTHSVIGVFANSKEVSKFVTDQVLENSKPDLPGMVFSDTPPAKAQPAGQVTMLFNYYNRGEWRYDPSSGKYLRWIETMPNELGDKYEMIPLTDRVTGKQLAFSNVILILAEYTELAPSKFRINIWGNDKGQTAYLFRDGVMTQGKWKAKNDSDPMQFLDKNGQPYALKPGNTWIVIAGLNSSFKETQPGKWEMFFMLP